jgi:hypothetical protein
MYILVDVPGVQISHPLRGIFTSVGNPAARTTASQIAPGETRYGTSDAVQ